MYPRRLQSVEQQQNKLSKTKMRPSSKYIKKGKLVYFTAKFSSIIFNSSIWAKSLLCPLLFLTCFMALQTRPSLVVSLVTKSSSSWWRAKANDTFWLTTKTRSFSRRWQNVIKQNEMRQNETNLLCLRDAYDQISSCHPRQFYWMRAHGIFVVSVDDRAEDNLKKIFFKEDDLKKIFFREDNLKKIVFKEDDLKKIFFREDGFDSKRWFGVIGRNVTMSGA